MYYIGISGWTYPPWRNQFYPDELPQRLELEFASRSFRSIEINGTHYGLQRPKSFKAWHDRTPEKFLFSVKVHRYITHLKRLHDVEIPIANFFASGVFTLKEKLGPFLWQFPPSFKLDIALMERFFSLLPPNTHAAARLARKSDLPKSHVLTRPYGKSNLRHCIEIRNQSFMVPEFFDLMRKYNVTFVFADTAGKWPYAEDLTGDFVYIRLHGDRKIYSSGYTEKSLQHWARRIRLWAAGKQPRDAKTITPREKPRKRDVYVYFDNDMKVKAPGDARRLHEILYGKALKPPSLSEF